MEGAKMTADALNRIADALFQQAKATREHVKVANKQLAIAEDMRDAQLSNLAVTKHLESELALRARGNVGGSA